MGRDRGRAAAPGRREDGAVIVEMALLLPLLLLVVFGIISISVLLSYRQTMVQASSEGARAAAVVDDAGGQASAALAAAQEAMDTKRTCAADGDGLTCTISAPARCSQDTTRLCRTVQITFDGADDRLVPRIPILGELVPEQMTAKATVIVPGTPP